MKRTKLISALAICLVLMLVLPVLASAATVKLAYSGGALNIRSGPGKEYSSVGTVHNGDTITVLNYGDVWSKIQAGSKTGYIKNLYINDGDKNYAAGTTYFGGGKTVYTTASVNFRAGADKGTKSMGTFSKGTKLTALGENNGFYLVKDSSGRQGYVSTKYLSSKNPGGGSSGGGGSTPSGKTKTVTASAVNMREGGGTSYGVVRVVYKGSTVSVIKTGNYWTYCSYKGSKGWIKSCYLK